MVVTCEPAAVCEQIATAQRELVIATVEAMIYIIVSIQAGAIGLSWLRRHREVSDRGG